MRPHEDFLVRLYSRTDYDRHDRARVIYGYQNAVIDFLHPEERQDILQDLDFIHTLQGFYSWGLEAAA